MKKLDQFLHTLFWVAPGMFAGFALYEYADYKARPGLYAMQSAPWYVDLEIQGIITAVLAAVLLAAMWLVRKNIDKKG